MENKVFGENESRNKFFPGGRLVFIGSPEAQNYNDLRQTSMERWQQEEDVGSGAFINQRYAICSQGERTEDGSDFLTLKDFV